ncbi:hypothetical protein AX15_004978 [Amanita polypyramis BW_CC]|nr:hypothetical protein AX15_004978 [Amanita polypyramis BW_CC]
MDGGGQVAHAALEETKGIDEIMVLVDRRDYRRERDEDRKERSDKDYRRKEDTRDRDYQREREYKRDRDERKATVRREDGKVGSRQEDHFAHETGIHDSASHIHQSECLSNVVIL